MIVASYMCGACDQEWEIESETPTAEPCPRCQCETEHYWEDDEKEDKNV